jgi:phospholipid N-methyltransferase
MLRDSFLFFREFCNRFETTGSMIPSSRFLARAITRPLSRRGGAPLRVLECGPGTGAFTDEIVGYLKPQDSFDVVELNGSFVRSLKRRLAADGRWQAVAGLTTVHHLPLQKFQPTAPYDFVISGLPHVNFPERTLAEILACYLRLLKPGGTLSYFEYMYIRPVRKALTLGVHSKRVRMVDSLMNAHLRRHRVHRDSILLNCPPAWVQHLIAP